MKVYTAPEVYKPNPSDIKVFLAGGITGCPKWQNEVIKELEILDKKEYDKDEESHLVVFNPRRDNFDIKKDSAEEQIKWEFYMLENCDIFSMYFCKDEIQPICMYELGRYITRMQMRFPSDWEDRIVITVEEGYSRLNDVKIQTQLATDIKFNLLDLVDHNPIHFHAYKIFHTYYPIRDWNQYFYEKRGF